MDDDLDRRLAAIATWLEVDRTPLAGLRGDVIDALERRMRDHQSAVLRGEFAGYLHDSVERYREEAQTDVLTGLLNRRGLMARLESGPAAWTAEWRIGLVLLDVDDLKEVNDTHGHIAGDEVLKVVGRRLRETVRTGDLVARIGGDEFVVACPAASPDGMRMLVQKLGRSLGATVIELPGENVTVGVSLGWAISGEGLEPRDLLHAADVEMYRAKRGGSAQVAPRRAR